MCCHVSLSSVSSHSMGLLVSLINCCCFLLSLSCSYQEQQNNWLLPFTVDVNKRVCAHEGSCSCKQWVKINFSGAPIASVIAVIILYRSGLSTDKANVYMHNCLLSYKVHSTNIKERSSSRFVRCCHGQFHIIHKCQSIINNVANCLTRLIHWPSINGHSLWPSIDHPWIKTRPGLLCLHIHRVTVPSMDHPWMATLPSPPLCLSIRGCQSYCVIQGASMDGYLASLSLSV